MYVTQGASQLTLQQPPTLTATLGHDVMMPCHISQEDEANKAPVLYWLKLSESTDDSILPPESERYRGRVERLDNDQQSANLSILLKAVQWADRGKYLCKLAVLDPKTNKRYSVKGNTTLLLIRGKYENCWDELRSARFKSNTDCKLNFWFSEI